MNGIPATPILNPILMFYSKNRHILTSSFLKPFQLSAFCSFSLGLFSFGWSLLEFYICNIQTRASYSCARHHSGQKKWHLISGLVEFKEKRIGADQHRAGLSVCIHVPIEKLFSQ